MVDYILYLIFLEKILNKIRKYHQWDDAEKNKLENPCIEIGRYYVRKSSTGIPLYNIAAILYTRQKDKIVLCINNPSSMKDEELAENVKPNVFKQKCHDIADKFKNFLVCIYRIIVL